MFVGVAEFTSKQQEDSAEFMRKTQALVVGVARDYEPARLYVVRIDNWFGPKWMHFAGKSTVGKGFAIGVHKTILHVPPFVPHRAVAERVFAGPSFNEAVIKPPLHVKCRASWRSQDESRKWIRRLHSYGSAVSPKRSSAVQSWCIYRLLLDLLRAADTYAVRPERFTSVSPSVKVAGSQRCCAGFRVVRLSTLRRKRHPTQRGGGRSAANLSVGRGIRNWLMLSVSCFLFSFLFPRKRKQN